MICSWCLSVLIQICVFLDDARADDVIGNRARRAERDISGSISEGDRDRLLLALHQGSDG